MNTQKSHEKEISGTADTGHEEIEDGPSSATAKKRKQEHVANETALSSDFDAPSQNGSTETSDADGSAHDSSSSKRRRQNSLEADHITSIAPTAHDAVEADATVQCSLQGFPSASQLSPQRRVASERDQSRSAASGIVQQTNAEKAASLDEQKKRRTAQMQWFASDSSSESDDDTTKEDDDQDTFVSVGSFQAALRAAGVVMHGVDRVILGNTTADGSCISTNGEEADHSHLFGH